MSQSVHHKSLIKIKSITIYNQSKGDLAERSKALCSGYGISRSINFRSLERGLGSNPRVVINFLKVLCSSHDTLHLQS